MNPRQYAATISDLPMVEVWLQRASDIVRRIRAGDIDMGILGYDMGESPPGPRRPRDPPRAHVP